MKKALILFLTALMLAEILVILSPIPVGAPLDAWVQTDWSGGATKPTVESGRWDSTYDKYYENDNVYTATAGEMKLITSKLSGHLESSVFDAGSTADWGNIIWNASLPTKLVGENNAVDVEPTTLVDESSRLGMVTGGSIADAQRKDSIYENLQECHSTIWWDLTWKCRKPVTVNNSGNPDNLENFQTRIFTTYDLDMLDNFDDIRFVDNDHSTVLSYWRENYNLMENATFWVKVPWIPASDNHTIWMYYGNPDAETENDGTAVFEFFDNFDNATKFSTVEYPYGDPQVAVYPNFVEFGNNGNEEYLKLGCYDEGELKKDLNLPFSNYKIIIKWRTENDPFEYNNADYTYYDDKYGASTWTPKRLIVINENKIYEKDKKCLSYGEKTEVSYTGTIDNFYLSVGSSGGDTPYCTYYDLAFIRKFTDPEPVTSVGVEEELTCRMNIEHRITGVVATYKDYRVIIYGYADTDENVGVYIWKHSESSWVLIDNLPTSAGGSITYALPENINNYIVEDNFSIRYFENNSDTTATTIHIDYCALEGTKLATTSIVMRTRTGTDNNPYDGSWNDWVQQDNNTKITSPDNRYIQYRVELSSENEAITPTFYNITINYTVPPRQPVLYSPTDGTITNDNTPTFEWTVGANADYHRLLVDNDADFLSPVENVLLGTFDNTYTPTTCLADENYSWKVIAINTAGKNESTTWTFLIDTVAPAAPSLLRPADGVTTNDNTVTFRWTVVTDPSGVTYTIQVDNDPDFTSPEVNISGLSENTYTSSALADENYSWHVQAVDGANNAGDWSTVWTFIIDTAAPVAPDLQDPADGTKTRGNTPTFVWSAVADPSGVIYTIQVDNNADFSSPEVDISGLTDNVYTPSALADENYSWRVRAVDNAGNVGDWSSIWTVLIDTVPPAVPTVVWPADGENINDNTPNLDWNAVNENSLPVTYDIWVDNDFDFASPTTSATGIKDDNYRVTTELAEGVWQWRVRAVDNIGNVGDNSQRSFRVDVTPPVAPTPLEPVDGAKINDNTPTFRWIQVTDASGVTYTIQVDNDADFNSLEVNVSGLTENTYTPSSLADENYSWRVRAIDNAGNEGSWSSVWALLIDTVPPSIPVLISPADGTITNDNTPTFEWSAVSDTTGVTYTLQVDNNSDFTSPEVNLSGLTENTYTPLPLADENYSWRVRAVDGASNLGDWSTVWTLLIDTTAPAVPGLLEPPDGTLTNDNTPTFDWSDVGAENYDLLVDNDSNFSSPEIQVTVSVSTYTPAAELANENYSWEVRARDAANNLSDWSTVWTFIVRIRAVEVSISPNYQSGLPSTTLTYTVTVTNTGAVEDTYDLSANDNGDWNPGIFPPWIILSPGNYANATLRVIVPPDAIICTKDLITVTARSQSDNAVGSSDSCIAHAGTTPHDPIHIVGNDNFTPANGVVSGSGTLNDPYIIQNWDMDASSVHGIWIENTDAYFIIKYCQVHGAGNYPNYGVYLDHVTNGEIYNVTSYFDNIGIYLDFSSNNLVSNCNTSNKNINGICLKSSSNNNIENCITYNNFMRGIYLYSSSDNNIISNCTAESNADGIYLKSSSNNNVEKCTTSNNVLYGIAIWSSKNNIVSNCDSHNNIYDIYLGDLSNNNHIYHNSFQEAWDECSNYWDNGYPSGGNYWGHYSGSDEYRGENQDVPGSDGIGDTPYFIPGDNNIDHYPLISRGLKLSISPYCREGMPRANLSYVVTITNTGNFADNYSLTVSDNAGWDSIITPSSLSVYPCGFANATLEVTVPENAENSDRDGISVVARSQTDNTVSAENSCVALAVIRGVMVTISPSYLSASPGAEITYTITVINAGLVDDTYNLSTIDNGGWGPSVLPSSLPVSIGENGAATLKVTIPEDAMPCTEDNITVVATSQADPEVSDNNWCIAHASVGPVNVLISPREIWELARENITFSVKVMNTGNIADNYDLIVFDNFGWSPMLSEDSLENVQPGENRAVTLSVTIPENAEPCTEDNITVIAISRTDPEVSDNNSCIAYVLLPKAEFSLVTLYKVGLDMNLWLENGSKLVVKLYKYASVYQTESVIDNFAPPIIIKENENIPHPSGLPVEIVRLVLTTDDTANEISTIASFTATKGVLASRYLKIKSDYVKPGADRPALAAEYLKTKSQYVKAP